MQNPTKRRCTKLLLHHWTIAVQNSPSLLSQALHQPWHSTAGLQNFVLPESVNEVSFITPSTYVVMAQKRANGFQQTANTVILSIGISFWVVKSFGAICIQNNCRTQSKSQKSPGQCPDWDVCCCSSCCVWSLSAIAAWPEASSQQS